MRKFIVNVNGNSYEVEVEEVGGGTTISQAVPAARPAVAEAAPTQAPAAPKPAAPKPAAPSGTVGAIKIQSPMPGSIIDIKVSVGESVKKGTVIAILEAMKMENELLAPQDATIASINVTKGQQVNTGDLIMSLN